MYFREATRYTNIECYPDGVAGRMPLPEDLSCSVFQHQNCICIYVLIFSLNLFMVFPRSSSTRPRCCR